MNKKPLPTNVEELITWAPELIPSLTRLALLRYQQGVFHSSDQLNDLVQDVYEDIHRRQTIGKFRPGDYETTPENGLLAFLKVAVRRIVLNILTRGRNREAFFIVINQGDDPDEEGLNANFLPMEDETPLVDALRQESEDGFAALVDSFADFLSDYLQAGTGDEAYAESIRLLRTHSLPQIAALHHVSKADLPTFRANVRMLYRLFERHLELCQ